MIWRRPCEVPEARLLRLFGLTMTREARGASEARAHQGMCGCGDDGQWGISLRARERGRGEHALPRR